MSCERCSQACCPEHCCDWSSRACEACAPARIQKKHSYEDLPLDEYIAGKVKERMAQQREAEAAVQRERDEKRRVEKARHDAVLNSVKETLSKNKEVMLSTTETLARLKTTIEGLKETEQKFADFQTKFQNILAQGLERAFGNQEDLEELRAQHGHPRICSLEEAAMNLADKERIVVIVGAGVSAESGVFTNKDSPFTWDIEGQFYSHEELLDIDILHSYPLEFWQYIQYIRFQMNEAHPNATHNALAEFHSFYKTLNRKVTVISLNFDSLDSECGDLIRLHGNLNNMRCLFGCTLQVYEAPGLETQMDFLPLCPACGAITRPDVLLCGEPYTEEHSGSDRAVAAIEDSDCLLVMGTQLKASLPNQLVKEFAKTQKLLIEVNIEPVIEFGNTLFVPEKCENVVPAMVSIIFEGLQQ